MAKKDDGSNKNRPNDTALFDQFFPPPEMLKDLNVASPALRQKRQGSKPARINIVPQNFDQVIEDQGVYCRITPAIICPNRTSLTDTNHVLDCPFCHGQGRIDVPDEAIETWALIQGIKLDKQFQVPGIYDLKDAMVTTKQSIKIFYWYKIEVLDFSAIYNDVIHKSTTDIDKLRYIPAAKTDVPYIAFSNGVYYQVDKDFKIQGTDIIWKGVNRPTAGKLFTISYPTLPTFRVLDLVHEHRYYYIDFKRTNKVPVHLPQQAVIRWDYLASAQGSQVAKE